jgi:hypothetical protein
MGAAAGVAKPGTPAGGKGVAQPQVIQSLTSTPTITPPAQISTVPAQGGGLGMGGVAGKGNAPVQPTVPAQGGKAQNPDGTYTGTLPGYAQPYVNSMIGQPQVQQRDPQRPMFPGMELPPVQGGFPQQPQADMGTLYQQKIQQYTGNPQVLPQQPGQVPAQGGKAPLTPEQRAAISANADPARGLGLNLGSMLYGGGGQQLAPGQVAPTQAEIDRLRPMLSTPMAPQPAYDNLMTQDKAAKLAEMERIRSSLTPTQQQNAMQYGDAYYGQPQRTLTPVEVAMSGLSQQPAPLMPTPAPVMTRPAIPRPTMRRPSLIGAGLAGLRGRR